MSLPRVPSRMERGSPAPGLVWAQLPGERQGQVIAVLVRLALHRLAPPAATGPERPEHVPGEGSDVR